MGEVYSRSLLVSHASLQCQLSGCATHSILIAGVVVAIVLVSGVIVAIVLVACVEASGVLPALVEVAKIAAGIIEVSIVVTTLVECACVIKPAIAVLEQRMVLCIRVCDLVSNAIRRTAQLEQGLMSPLQGLIKFAASERVGPWRKTHFLQSPTQG